jgi:hypothetical protein
VITAGSSGGAQLYVSSYQFYDKNTTDDFKMECAQINVSGGTGATTPSTVSFPGAYSGSDPGILINIYQTLTSYTIPGPVRKSFEFLLSVKLELAWPNLFDATFEDILF